MAASAPPGKPVSDSRQSKVAWIKDCGAFGSSIAFRFELSERAATEADDSADAMKNASNLARASAYALSPSSLSRRRQNIIQVFPPRVRSSGN